MTGAYLCSSRLGTQAEVASVRQEVRDGDGDGYVCGDNGAFPATCDDLPHAFLVTFAAGRGGELFQRHRPIVASAAWA